MTRVCQDWQEFKVIITQIFLYLLIKHVNEIHSQLFHIYLRKKGIRGLPGPIGLRGQKGEHGLQGLAGK